MRYYYTNIFECAQKKPSLSDGFLVNNIRLIFILYSQSAYSIKQNKQYKSIVKIIIHNTVITHQHTHHLAFD